MPAVAASALLTRGDAVLVSAEDDDDEEDDDADDEDEAAVGESPAAVGVPAAADAGTPVSRAATNASMLTLLPPAADDFTARKCAGT